MEHIIFIVTITIILVLIIIYYEYCYKNIVLEKFEVQLGKWDDVIGLQVLRDMLGIFFDGPKGTFNIPGGISVRELIPTYSVFKGRIGFDKWRKGERNDSLLQIEHNMTL